MNLEFLKKHYGSVEAIASVCGVSKWAIYKWQTRGVPYGWQTFFRMMMHRK
jgi:transposase